MATIVPLLKSIEGQRAFFESLELSATTLRTMAQAVGVGPPNGTLKNLADNLSLDLAGQWAQVATETVPTAEQGVTKYRRRSNAELTDPEKLLLHYLSAARQALDELKGGKVPPELSGKLGQLAALITEFVASPRDRKTAGEAVRPPSQDCKSIIRSCNLLLKILAVWATTEDVVAWLENCADTQPENVVRARVASIKKKRREAEQYGLKTHGWAVVQAGKAWSVRSEELSEFLAIPNDHSASRAMDVVKDVLIEANKRLYSPSLRETTKSPANLFGAASKIRHQLDRDAGRNKVTVFTANKPPIVTTTDQLPVGKILRQAEPNVPGILVAPPKDNPKKTVRKQPRTPKAKTGKSSLRFVPTPFQRAILDALNGRALRSDAAASKLGDRRKFFRAKKELEKRKLIAHHRRLGFYRPDALPPELSAPT